MSVTAVDGPAVVWEARGGFWVARGRSSTATTPLPEGDRPTGPKYVRYEDLYVAGDTFKQVIAKVTGARVLTLPEGQFTWNDFATGYVDGIRLGNGGYTGCAGIAGSGRGTVLRMAPGSSTKASTIASISASSGTNPAYLININRMNGCEFRNFSLEGTDQGHEYNGLRVELSDDSLVDNLYLRGASPGSANSPPGETFGINIARSPRATVSNCEVDGRHPTTGARICASPVGWNTTSDALVEGCYLHHGRTGMLTFWRTTNVTVQDSVMHSTASGGGNQSGSAINFEDCNGSIRVVNNRLRPWGRWEVQHGGTATDLTDNNGLHLAFASGLAQMTDIRVYLPAPVAGDPLPTFDRGPHSTGALAIANWFSYPNQQTDVMQAGALRIWNHLGQEMTLRDTSVTGYGSGVTRDTHALVYR